LATHSFTFRGFPPRKSGKRRRFLEVDRASPHTLVFYESCYRIAALVEDALAVYGDRKAAAANDLTKKFEKVRRGTLSQLQAELASADVRGEWVLVVAGAGDEDDAEPEPDE
jgi:16S rRNA (cytidine1402-2'-O)-methyltransferase